MRYIHYCYNSLYICFKPLFLDIKKTCVVGDNRLETRLKILLKFKTNKIVLEPERYSGFYLDVPPDAARGGKGRGDVTLTE